MTDLPHHGRRAAESSDPNARVQHAPNADEELRDEPGEPVDFAIVKDETLDLYTVVVDDHEVAGLPYNKVGDDRLVLLATSVVPEYRGKGIATALIQNVLDDARRHEMTITIMCPIVRAFIDKNPEYASLVSAEHPGVDGAIRHRGM